MDYFIDTTSQKEMEDLFKFHDDYKKKNKLRYPTSHSWSHLEQSTYDWRIENNWTKKLRFVRVMRKKDTNEVTAAIFWSYTQNKLPHCTLRHIYVLEEFRGLSLAVPLYDYMIRHSIESGVRRIRLFANKTSLTWHLKRGMKFIGFNKRQQPFTYLPLFDVEGVKELGQVYERIGYQRLIEQVEPEVDKQMNRIIKFGGRWLTQEEIQEYW